MANEVRLILGAATDVGTVREVNEDSHGFVRCALGDLLVVCDGMGGHAAGDLASKTARDSILSHVLTSHATDERELLRDAIVEGHRAVRRIADASPDRAGMGTTVVAALVRADRAWIANVGDSRCYLVRDGLSTLLSKDHTKGQRLLEAGIITAIQLETHPEKGVLTQALGQREDPQPAVTESTRLRVGDALVLCSDGVYESMHNDIADIAAAKNPNYSAHDLVTQAVARDGKDNATVVVARYADLDAAAVPQPSPRVAPVQSPLATRVRKMWWAVPAALVVLTLGIFVGRGCAPKATKPVGSPVAVPANKAPAPPPIDRADKRDEPNDLDQGSDPTRRNQDSDPVHRDAVSPSPQTARDDHANESEKAAANKKSTKSKSTSTHSPPPLLKPEFGFIHKS